MTIHINNLLWVTHDGGKAPDLGAQRVDRFFEFCDVTGPTRIVHAGIHCAGTHPGQFLNFKVQTRLELK
ncbi:MAG: hypothetical protein M3Y35_15920 [Actinomycetota bacterium]|nr:hypothetical protein [Actinomycetota bacterium]